MLLKLIGPDSPELKALHRINRESFPENEYVPIERHFELNRLFRDDVLAMIEQGRVVGFVSMMPYKTCAYICYFAVAPECRGMGIGSKALQALKGHYAGQQIVVDFESLNDQAPNNAQRICRHAFYARNGIRLSNLYLYYMEEEFVVGYSGDSFDEPAFHALLDNINRAVPDFKILRYKKGANGERLSI